VIPKYITYVKTQEVIASGGPISLDNGWGGPASRIIPFAAREPSPSCSRPKASPSRFFRSHGRAEGQQCHARLSAHRKGLAHRGTVVLQATISRNGTIENLRVASGSPLLQQAALDAVAQWRYKPYLLDGQPVEVETTVEVQFKLN